MQENRNFQVLRKCYQLRHVSRRQTPRSLFPYSKLHILKLKSTGRLTYIPTQLCLEQLETLYLERVSFNGLDLSSRCPNLVELSIVGFYLMDSNTLKICAPQLARLNISCSFCYSRDWEVVLSSPKLTAFNFKASSPVVLRTDELMLLETIRIDVDYKFARCKIDEQKKFGRDAMNMLQKLHTAQHVSLTMPIVEVYFSTMFFLFISSFF